MTCETLQGLAARLLSASSLGDPRVQRCPSGGHRVPPKFLPLFSSPRPCSSPAQGPLLSSSAGSPHHFLPSQEASLDRAVECSARPPPSPSETPLRAHPPSGSVLPTHLVLGSSEGGPVTNPECVPSVGCPRAQSLRLLVWSSRAPRALLFSHPGTPPHALWAPRTRTLLSPPRAPHSPPVLQVSHSPCPKSHGRPAECLLHGPVARGETEPAVGLRNCVGETQVSVSALSMPGPPGAT